MGNAEMFGYYLEKKSGSFNNKGKTREFATNWV